MELNGTQVTDAGLEELKNLQAIDFVDLARTKVTKASVTALQKALPETMISY